MFPVVSNLRRAAAHVVYVRPERLSRSDGHLCVPLERDASFADPTSGNWQPAVRQVPVQVLQAAARGRHAAEEVAMSLALRENKIAEGIGVPDTAFTLICGPEEELWQGDTLVRKVPLAVIYGIHRLTPFREVQLAPAQRTGALRPISRPLRPGTVKL